MLLGDIRLFLGELDNVLLLLALVTPFITAFVARPFAADWQKGLVSLVSTATVAAVTKWLQDDSMTWSLFLSSWLQLVIGHLVAWEFLLRKPAAEINARTAGFVGSKPAGVPAADVIPDPAHDHHPGGH